MFMYHRRVNDYPNMHVHLLNNPGNKYDIQTNYWKQWGGGNETTAKEDVARRPSSSSSRGGGNGRLPGRVTRSWRPRHSGSRGDSLVRLRVAPRAPSCPLWNGPAQTQLTATQPSTTLRFPNTAVMARVFRGSLGGVRRVVPIDRFIAGKRNKKRVILRE